MGSIAARHARTVLAGVERILAIELIVAAQALDLRVALLAADTGATGAGGGGVEVANTPGAGVAEALRRVRARIAHLDRDREPGPDLAAATAMVHDGVLADLTEPPVDRGAP